MHRLLILTLSTAIPATPPVPTVVPGYVDGGRLAAVCDPTAPDTEASGSLCLGYVAGSVDQLLARQARRPLLRHTICLPKNLPVEQLVEVIEEHLKRYPRVKEFAASTVIRDALERRYPCKPEPNVGGR